MLLGRTMTACVMLLQRWFKDPDHQALQHKGQAHEQTPHRELRIQVSFSTVNGTEDPALQGFSPALGISTPLLALQPLPGLGCTGIQQDSRPFPPALKGKIHSSSTAEAVPRLGKQGARDFRKKGVSPWVVGFLKPVAVSPATSRAGNSKFPQLAQLQGLWVMLCSHPYFPKASAENLHHFLESEWVRGIRHRCEYHVLGSWHASQRCLRPICTTQRPRGNKRARKCLSTYTLTYLHHGCVQSLALYSTTPTPSRVSAAHSHKAYCQQQWKHGKLNDLGKENPRRMNAPTK